MTTHQQFFVPVAPPAMGLAKKHLYRDCRHIANAVVRTIPATYRLVHGLPTCKACEKRQAPTLEIPTPSKEDDG